MQLHLAQSIAHSLMIKHGLISQGWTFELDNSLRRFGVCKYRRKLISLSRHLIMLNGEYEVTDCILHEIAHALAGHKAGHGWAWKQVCIRIGAKPERCYDTEEVTQPQMRYQATCGGCNKVWQKVKRPDNTRKRSCSCQRGISWDKRHLLVYVDTKINLVGN